MSAANSQACAGRRSHRTGPWRSSSRASAAPWRWRPRLGDGAVELAGAMGRSDIGPDDALQMDLASPGRQGHRKVRWRFRRSGARACATDAIAVDNGDPGRLSAIRSACVSSGMKGGPFRSGALCSGTSGRIGGLIDGIGLLTLPWWSPLLAEVSAPWPFCPSVRSKGTGAIRRIRARRPDRAKQAGGQAGVTSPCEARVPALSRAA